MERQKYCVYNRTSECFLSLGVTLAADALGYLGQIFRNGRKAAEESQWVVEPKPIHSLRLFSCRDLIILDEQYRVLQAVESWPSFRIVRLREEAASMLSLPVHTIYSSQTQPGHQFLICPPEEMKEKLRESRGPETADEAGTKQEPAALAETGSGAVALAKLRKSGSPDVPKFVAYDPRDSSLRMFGVRDVDHSGLFLITDERWPVGAQVTLTLQRMDSASDSLSLPVTVELRVARWGDAGMGFAFVRPGALEPLLSEAIGR
jgi:hypothetical protein